MLAEKPFSSCKVLCRHFGIGEAMRLRIFHDKLGLKTFHFRCVPLALSINQKNQRVLYSKLLLTALREQKASGFQRIIIGDESWFFFDHLRDSVRAASRDEFL
jgi:hypothetical protein